MRVEELMTADVVRVRPETTVAQSARLMAAYGVGALPVTGADGRLRGILTDRDIVLRCVAGDAEPQETTAGQLMSRGPVTIPPEADVREAAAVMAGSGVRRLPVTRDGRLVGMLSLADLARVRNAGAETALAGISGREGDRRPRGRGGARKDRAAPEGQGAARRKGLDFSPAR